jgi:DNA-binding CsgD family transcriptional regulator
VVSGAMNKQIAFGLGISEITVKLHRSNMMKKMNARSVSHLFNVCQSLPTDIQSQLKMASTAGKVVAESVARAHLA